MISTLEYAWQIKILLSISLEYLSTHQTMPLKTKTPYLYWQQWLTLHTFLSVIMSMVYKFARENMTLDKIKCVLHIANQFPTILKGYNPFLDRCRLKMKLQTRNKIYAHLQFRYDIKSGSNRLGFTSLQYLHSSRHKKYI